MKKVKYIEQVALTVMANLSTTYNSQSDKWKWKTLRHMNQFAYLIWNRL